MPTAAWLGWQRPGPARGPPPGRQPVERRDVAARPGRQPAERRAAAVLRRLLPGPHAAVLLDWQPAQRRVAAALRRQPPASHVAAPRNRQYAGHSPPAAPPFGP